MSLIFPSPEVVGALEPGNFPQLEMQDRFRLMDSDCPPALRAVGQEVLSVAGLATPKEPTIQFNGSIVKPAQPHRPQAHGWHIDRENFTIHIAADFQPTEFIVGETDKDLLASKLGTVVGAGNLELLGELSKEELAECGLTIFQAKPYEVVRMHGMRHVHRSPRNTTSTPTARHWVAVDIPSFAPRWPN